VRDGLRAYGAQDGWIAIFRDTECFWEPTLAEALDRGVAEVEAWDGSEGPVEVGSTAGSFTVQRAYRVDFRAAARIAAAATADALCEGAVETSWTDDHELAHRMESDLARAFAAQIERIYGPWYEALGRDEVTVEVARVSDDHYGVSSLRGNDAIVKQALLEGDLRTLERTYGWHR
jgi:hypothetical protein